ncbi:hypothetical protein B0H13DRAFT_1996694 [Mycena leptocephala]|nr:hypothetical protein B0H13DRAFT_1996694 [Mycena leptocephala]
MSTKNRAIDDTEDEFQAALATYTKAGNKTAAMRRLWNAAYGIGGERAVASMTATIKKAGQTGFEEGQQSGFEEGRKAGEKDALSMDAFAVSFSAGKMDGIATGMELGREAETKRWKESGHFEDGTCRIFDEIHAISVADTCTLPPQLPSLDGNTPAFSWADDAYSLPIHTVQTSAPPRDFSGLRSDSTNPFDTLQRRHARYCGARTRTRPSRGRLYSGATPATTRHGLPHAIRPRLELAIRSKPSSGGNFSILALLAWVWMLVHGQVQGRVSLGRRSR